MRLLLGCFVVVSALMPIWYLGTRIIVSTKHQTGLGMLLCGTLVWLASVGTTFAILGLVGTS